MAFDLLVVPVKKPYEVDIVKPLKNLIQSSYSSSGSEYTEASTEFGKMRNSAVFKVYEKYESSLPVVYNYFDQLCALETKIPVQELQVPFKYKDAFDKGTIFGGRASLTVSSLAFEKVCLLFNIAALQSAVAANQSFDSDDGLKAAAKLFQQSSGIFAHLKGAAPAAIPQEPTPDLNPDCLQVLSSLMVAQAQEVFILKAMRDNVKELLIAKLCCQCEEMYADVLKIMQKESLRTLWDKEWITTVAGKQAGFHGLTMLYQSLVNRANKQVGQEISRLQKAVELFNAAKTRSGKPSFFEEYANKAQRHLTEAKKDNDFIYNEQIPDINTLEGPGKMQLAKSQALAPPLNKEFKDIFANLVPVALHQALVASDARKTELINAEIMKLRESTQTLNAILSSLNLPAAIEDTAKGTSVPPSLLEKANTLRSKGGIESIRSLIDELPEALKRNREILDEAERLLNDERDSDNQLRAQFKEKWTRTPSDKLTEMFRTNVTKYREIINNAVAADRVVREKFDNNVVGMELLSKTPSELQEAIPQAAGERASLSPSSQRLRELMHKVDQIKSDRDSLESELKSATLDIKEKFLEALAADGAIDEAAISVSELGKAFSPYQRRVQASLQEQEQLVAEIQEQHAEFSRESGAGTNSRDALLKQLAAAYDVFTELQNNLKEGSKFYNDLTELLIIFQNKISDYCFARKTEKEELMKDLTSATSRSAVPATPSIPQHHSDASNFSATSAGSGQPSAPGNVPYPTQIPNMPIPYGASSQAPYPTYMPPPMPQCFNPYATLPYPGAYQFPQGPQYGTWPGPGGSYPGYPQQPPQ
uniref:CSON012055 protein n=1 Tax=Culicoides sonorensis TaxID=179676 RepID=A0A336M9W6_CULSO